MKRLILLMCFLFMLQGVSFATTFTHSNPNEMDTIGKPFDGQDWANYKSKDAYDGPKESYDVKKLQNDPEVLIAISDAQVTTVTTDGEVKQTHEIKVVEQKRKDVDSVEVRTQWCWEQGTEKYEVKDSYTDENGVVYDCGSKSEE